MKSKVGPDLKMKLKVYIELVPSFMLLSLSAQKPHFSMLSSSTNRRESRDQEQLKVGTRLPVSALQMCSYK